MSLKPERRRMRILWARRLFSGLLLLLIIACVAGVFIGGRIYLQPDEEAPALTVDVVPVEQMDLSRSVQVNGALEPRGRARVAFAEGVRVREVLVAQGDTVQQGQPLARLDTRDLELKVASNKALVEQAQQVIDELLKPPTDAALAEATARIARARADIVAADQEVTEAEVANAQATLDNARQYLADLEAGRLPADLRGAEEQVRRAEEDVAVAREGLEQTRDSASRAKTDAERAMIEGAQAIELAQRAYSDAYWDWDIVSKSRRDPRQTEIDDNGNEVKKRLNDYEVEEYRRKLVDAERELKNAEANLETLRNALETAREDEIREIEAAQRTVAASERALEEAKRNSEIDYQRNLKNELLNARKAVADAEKAYRDLIDNPTRPAKQAELNAALLEALANLEKLSAGPDEVELARARTDLERARADLAEAEAELEKATLFAPINGTVVEISIQAGSTAKASDVIQLADLSRFLIRGQVTEEDITSVRAGLPVDISIDSVPDGSFTGKVVRVEELPKQTDESSGDMGGPIGGLYPIEIELETGDERLRVGMATTASILVFSLPEALVVPLQAIYYDAEGKPFVKRLTNNIDANGTSISEETPVELGLTNEDMVQIVSGLTLDDSVLVEQLPPPEDGAQPSDNIIGQ